MPSDLFGGCGLELQNPCDRRSHGLGGGTEQADERGTSKRGKRLGFEPTTGIERIDRLTRDHHRRETSGVRIESVENADESLAFLRRTAVRQRGADLGGGERGAAPGEDPWLELQLLAADAPQEPFDRVEQAGELGGVGLAVLISVGQGGSVVEVLIARSSLTAGHGRRAHDQGLSGDGRVSVVQRRNDGRDVLGEPDRLQRVQAHPPLVRGSVGEQLRRLVCGGLCVFVGAAPEGEIGGLRVLSPNGLVPRRGIVKHRQHPLQNGLGVGRGHGLPLKTEPHIDGPNGGRESDQIFLEDEPKQPTERDGVCVAPGLENGLAQPLLPLGGQEHLLEECPRLLALGTVHRGHDVLTHPADFVGPRGRGLEDLEDLIPDRAGLVHRAGEQQRRVLDP